MDTSDTDLSASTRRHARLDAEAAAAMALRLEGADATPTAEAISSLQARLVAAAGRRDPAPTGADDGFAAVSDDEALQRQFGYRTFGPILAHFCTLLWLLLEADRSKKETALLFCARGGLTLHHLLKTFLARTGTKLPVRTSDFMVSRLAAARGAIVRRSAAVADELQAEFADYSMGQVASFLTTLPPCDRSPWDAPFDARRFYRLLDTTEEGRHVSAAIAEQERLFKAHLESAAGSARRIVICDTGLFGSTLLFLREGYPKYEWRSILLARSNYKHSPHFPANAVGVITDRRAYHPLFPETAILRYWHLTEAMLEPDLPSVTTFHADTSGTVRSNLEVAGWRKVVEEPKNPFLLGALAYISGLDRQSWYGLLSQDLGPAWRKLKRSVVFPGRRTSTLLAVGPREVNFGQSRLYGDALGGPSQGLLARAAQVKDAPWKEGAMVRLFPLAFAAGLVLIEAIHWGRLVAAALGDVRHWRRSCLT